MALGGRSPGTVTDRVSGFAGSSPPWKMTGYRPERLGDLLRLLEDLATADGDPSETEGQLRERLGLPHWNAGRDIWLAEPTGLPAGSSGTPAAAPSGGAPGGLCGWAGVQTFGPRQTGRPGTIAWLHGGVHPNWRRLGLGGELLNLALGELRSRHGSRLRTVNVSVDGVDPGRARFLERRGFARRRTVRTFRWTPEAHEEVVQALPGPAGGYRASLLTPDAADLRGVAEVMSRVYAGDPGRSRVTADCVRAIVGEPGFARGASFGLYRGRFMVGFCLGLLTPEGHGTIDSLGVLEEHRGRGFGLYLVRLCCGALSALGAASVELAVVGDNKPALRTYRKAGFTLTSSSATFVLDLARHSRRDGQYRASRAAPGRAGPSLASRAEPGRVGSARPR